MANLSTEEASKILDRAIRSLASDSQITRTTPGSKARTLLGIMSNEIEKLSDVVSANVIVGMLSGATGPYLDYIGALVGASRGTVTSAESSEYTENVRIYCPSGETAGSMNSGKAIIIPGGTFIFSSDDQFRYYTTYTVRIEPAESEIFLSVRSSEEGQAGNVSAGTLTKLTFTSYSSYPSRTLLVQNRYSIDNGRVEESDQVFKYRIANAHLAAESSNMLALRSAALTVPSVSDMLFLNMYRGIGTADIILDTVTGVVSNTSLEQVRNSISSKIAIGIDVQVRPPRLAGIEITIRPRFAPNTSNLVKVEAANAMRQAISNLIAQIRLGGTLIVNDIAFVARNSHPSIIDVGSPNKPLEEVFLWRDSKLSIRAPIILPAGRNIELPIDQRLILEGSPNQAIRIL
jgi:uncharacterized phage protein gp47/JayE